MSDRGWSDTTGFPEPVEVVGESDTAPISIRDQMLKAFFLRKRERAGRTKWDPKISFSVPIFLIRQRMLLLKFCVKPLSLPGCKATTFAKQRCLWVMAGGLVGAGGSCAASSVEAMPGLG